LDFDGHTTFTQKSEKLSNFAVAPNAEILLVSARTLVFHVASEDGAYLLGADERCHDLLWRQTHDGLRPAPIALLAEPEKSGRRKRAHLDTRVRVTLALVAGVARVRGCRGNSHYRLARAGLRFAGLAGKVST
jgi:hypothetical protein